jgi:large subunit ribosomal protein L14e
MASIEIGATSWRRVEVGRVLKLESGSLATIVEIIDHKRVRGTRPLPSPPGASRDVYETG